MDNNNAVINTILVILMILVAGFIFWFILDRRMVESPREDDGGANIEIDLGGNGAVDGGSNTGY